MNTQKQHQKKKDREREVRKKVLRRRARIRAEAKEEKEKAMADREAQKVVNRHTVTIWHGKEGRMSDDEIKARLAHNMQILQALEAEYEAEQKVREENSRHVPDMLEKLRQQSQQLQEPPRNWGGEAEVVFKPNLPEDKPEQPAPPAEEEKKE